MKMTVLKVILTATFLSVLKITEPVQLNEPLNVVEPQMGLKDCLKMEERSNDLGYCFGRDMLSKLQNYEEKDAITFTDAVKLVRDEQTPRNLDSFLDKDPMDIRSIMEGASSLISRRSLQWDLSGIYPGLCMKIGPTLANGVLEFAVDHNRPNQDRGYYGHEESTGHVLAKQFLVPLLLGLKFKLSTILPLILGLLLFASKKAFILAKLALIAISIFGAGGAAAAIGSSSYPVSGGGYYHGTGPGGYITRHHHGGSSPEYFSGYREDDIENVPRSSTGPPISPTELRQRLERLFVTKHDKTNSNHGNVVRDSRNFAWAS